MPTKELSITNEMLLSSEKAGGFSIAPFTDTTMPSNLTKIQTTDLTKSQLRLFMQQLPQIAGASESQTLYAISFPEGVSGTLMHLNQGGLATVLQDPETGKITGMASLYEVHTNNLMLGAFTAMSLVTGQYFLAEINRNFKVINLKIDKILEFLYGDKKAELLAEIKFARYAYSNYSSIMRFNEQRIATITGLQEAKKIAAKDIEFYLDDLTATVTTGNDLISSANKSFQIYESLNLSLQLYAVATLLEVYYSQNTSEEYTEYLEEDLDSFIEKCSKRTLADFSILKTKIETKKSRPLPTSLKKGDLDEEVSTRIEIIRNEETSKQYADIRKALHALTEPIEYVVSTSGDLYAKSI